MIEYVLAVMARNLGYMQRLVADVPDERMCEQPAGYSNHPAWQIGHTAVTCDFVGGMLGLEPALPAAWQGLFGVGTKPTDNASAYPSKAELTQGLEKVYARLREALKAADASTLAQPLPEERLRAIFPTVGTIAVSVATSHIAVHCGQLSAWRKLAGLPSALGI